MAEARSVLDSKHILRAIWVLYDPRLDSYQGLPTPIAPTGRPVVWTWEQVERVARQVARNIRQSAPQVYLVRKPDDLGVDLGEPSLLGYDGLVWVPAGPMEAYYAVSARVEVPMGVLAVPSVQTGAPA